MGDELIHRHGTSTIKYGRGAVLTIDLTNRCNMMCSPCFMDANQVGYVHELTMEEIEKILDDSISFKPRRQMSVQFSGGEPTLSPHFLAACRYAKKVGYKMVQAATNGLRFALEPDFAAQAKEAGFDMAYLQFDGVTNEANSHRKISNLFDVKKIAIDNMYAAGIKITPVVTIVNGLNNQSVGPIVDFCMENHDKVGGPAFQPVSFTGRDEEISDEERHRQRYTTSHLAHELSRYYDGKIDPLRDWFPLGSGVLVRRAGRPHERARRLLRAAQLRLPPQLRRLRDAGAEPAHQGLGARLGLLRHRPVHEGHRRDRGHRARPRAVLRPDRPLLRAELRRAQGARRASPWRACCELFKSRAAGRQEGRRRHATRPGTGSSSGSGACGSRTCGPTTSGAPRCA